MCLGDCVEISGPPAAFIGRIICTTYNTGLLQFDAAVHPTFSSAANTSDMDAALINPYLQCDDDIVLIPSDKWPTVSTKHKQCCIGLKQVSITNMVVWVHGGQIFRIVFCPHLSDCVHQTFGPLGVDCTHITGNLKSHLRVQQIILSNHWSPKNIPYLLVPCRYQEMGSQQFLHSVIKSYNPCMPSVGRITIS